MSKVPNRKLAVLVAVLLATLTLRIFRLESQSLWWDEGISLHLATSGLAEIVRNRAANIHPPLYYFILKGWVMLTGLTPFAARYLSVLASLSQVTAVYAVSRRWFGQSMAVWLATILSAISPLSIVYGQEARVYAFMPLVFLALLVLVRPLTRTGVERSNRFWVLLGVIEWIGLHLHYTTLFLVVFLNMLLLLTHFRRQDWPLLKSWLVTQTAVAVASLPWLILVLVNRTAVQGRVQTAKFITEPVDWRYLLAQVGVFHLTGLPGTLARTEIQILAIIIFACLLLLWIWRLLSVKKRSLTIHLAAFWLLPLCAALTIWYLRSFSHPRYLVIFAIGLIPLTAYLLVPDRPWNGLAVIPPVLAAITGCSFLIISFLGLGYYFFDASVAKDDMRGVARYLETAVLPEELIIIPDTDWSLPFEYHGEATVLMPGLEGDGLWDNLQQWTAVSKHVYFVDYPRGTRDWQDIVPFALEKDGFLRKETHFDGLVVREYVLERPLAPPSLTSLNTQFGQLKLMGAWVEDKVPADSAITVALRWQLTQPTNDRHHIALRMMDVDEWQISGKDNELLDENGRPTNQWSDEGMVTTYHILPIPLGTPPLTYDLKLGVYVPELDGIRSVDLLDEQGAPQGQQLLLEDVTLTPSVSLASAAYEMEELLQKSEPVELEDGLWLVSAVPDYASGEPGQSIDIHLVWQVTSILPALQPKLILIQDGAELPAIVDESVMDQYPTFKWQQGELVRDHRRLILPSSIKKGSAELMLALGERRVSVAQIDVLASGKLFEKPPINYPLDVQFGNEARLIGYDLPQEEFTNDEVVPLTLYWQSMVTGTAENYSVFTHILAEDGHLVGQHDGVPGNGRFPTNSWLAGEYIIDPHEIAFRELDYEGQARIEVGMYDSATGKRLLTESGGDFFYIPLNLKILSH